jgi:23S rRNA U2552 (ribose-2'-O)-methylase RlmE/FtsJ
MSLQPIKQLLRRALPGVVQKRNARRLRSQFREAYFDRQHDNARRLFGANSPSVLLGPFAGTKYFNEVVWGPIEPKWIGYYEAELHSIFESMQPDAYDVIVDVGSAEGYYSVSMARKFKKAKVISYDTDPWAREQQTRLAILNGCHNITIRRSCTARRLENDIKRSKRSLVICDVEGFEYVLFDPTKTPSLRCADILIEIHNSLDGRLDVDCGCRELTSRFSTTHSAQVLVVEKRDLNLISSQLPAGSLSLPALADATNEHRPSHQKWLWLQANSK